ncbi:hypothetical protein CARUB_v10025323mg [Capsella rubella]|uniref:Uncharacterized protein n=1 Tax=Capsella rubella TaxID=81985 RepID=R0G101_9BRAS|nr:hypothetical protein CARUB_v10025323mg [Capsella rubella]
MGRWIDLTGPGSEWAKFWLAHSKLGVEAWGLSEGLDLLSPRSSVHLPLLTVEGSRAIAFRSHYDPISRLRLDHHLFCSLYFFFCRHFKQSS